MKITNREEFVALAPTSYVKVHFNDDSQPDYFLVRTDSRYKGASAGGGMGMAGGIDWENVWDAWGDVSIELLYSPTA